MGVALSDLNILVPCQRLREFEVARGFENRRNKIMPERVGSDVTFRFASENLPHALGDDVATCRWRDRLDLFARAFIVAGEEGQGMSVIAVSIACVLKKLFDVLLRFLQRQPWHIDSAFATFTNQNHMFFSDRFVLMGVKRDIYPFARNKGEHTFVLV